MANAVDFIEGWNQDLVVEDKIQRACAEIFQTYNHIVKVNRKSLRKYGRNSAVGTGEFDITPFTVGAYTTQTHLLTNGIDSMSSDDAADTDVPIYIEGLTIDANNELNFTAYVQNTNASNGRPGLH